MGNKRIKETCGNKRINNKAGKTSTCCHNEARNGDALVRSSPRSELAVHVQVTALHTEMMDRQTNPFQLRVNSSSKCAIARKETGEACGSVTN